MTTTLTNMIDEVLVNLAGYTFQQDRSTYITSAVTTTTSTSASPLILSLGSTDSVGKGILEIDEELLWVDSFDRVANTATVSPYGRGYLGTTAATHTADAKVTISPTFPRFSVKRAINDTIRSLGANIFAVKSTTFTFNAAVSTYAFANLNIKNILTVSWQSIGPTKEWVPIRKWDLDASANPEAFGYTSGTDQVQTITLGEAPVSGRTVKVVYATDPEPFTSNSQVYTTVTGLPESTRDVVILGTAYRLLSFLDPARAAQVSPQADETDSKRPYGASQSATKQLYALYTQRLNEETKAQQQNYPPRIHYSRRNRRQRLPCTGIDRRTQIEGLGPGAVLKIRHVNVASTQAFGEVAARKVQGFAIGGKTVPRFIKGSIECYHWRCGLPNPIFFGAYKKIFLPLHQTAKNHGLPIGTHRRQKLGLVRIVDACWKFFGLKRQWLFDGFCRKNSIGSVALRATNDIGILFFALQKLIPGRNCSGKIISAHLSERQLVVQARLVLWAQLQRSLVGFYGFQVVLLVVMDIGQQDDAVNKIRVFLQNFIQSGLGFGKSFGVDMDAYFFKLLLQFSTQCGTGGIVLAVGKIRQQQQ